MTKKEFNRVNCNLLQAEIYARNAQMCVPCVHNYSGKKYNELRNVDVANGIAQVPVEVPYPITPDSVKSYAASADYRNDPAAAMAMQPPAPNLGDLTDVQKVLSADMESARELYANLKQVFESAAAAKSATETATENKESEVIENG